MSQGDPNGPKNDSPLTPEEIAELERQLDAASETVAERKAIEAQRQKTPGKLRALFVTTEILRDPSAARRLSDRHNSRVRTEHIARHMYDSYALSGKERDLAQQELEMERLSAEQDGVFVFGYPEALESERLTATHPDGSPEYLIVETSGAHPEKGHKRHGPATPAADAQIHIPEASRSAAPVFAIPDEGREPVRDHVQNKKLLEQMVERPHMVAQLDDIVTDSDMAGRGLALHALDAGLRHIVERVNPERGDLAIEHIVAEIVSIRGMILKGGHELFLDEEIPGWPILNGRSMVFFEHFRSPFIERFQPVWTLENRHVPVKGHSHVESLIASWYVRSARFKRA